MPDARSKGYANPDVLATTEWVAGHLHDPSVRIVESNEDTLLYGAGHIPGAVEVDWTRDLNDQVRREEFDVEQGAVGEVLNLVEARNARHGRAAPDIDEDPGRAQSLAADRHRLR